MLNGEGHLALLQFFAARMDVGLWWPPGRNGPEDADRGDDAQMWLGPVRAEYECEHAQREDS